MLVIALFILPHLWNWPGWPLIILALLVIGGWILVAWHARNCGYTCSACGFHFAITAWADFLSPHKSGEKMLRCPRCGVSSWCDEIERESVPPNGLTVRPKRSGLSSGATGKLLQIGLVLAVWAYLWIDTLGGGSTIFTPSDAVHFFKIPIAATVIAALHFVFCLYAATQGYRSRIYPAVTGFVLFFLLLAIWSQHGQLAAGQ